MMALRPSSSASTQTQYQRRSPITTPPSVCSVVMAPVECAYFLEAQVAVGVPVQAFEVTAAAPLDGVEFVITIDIGVPEVAGDPVSLLFTTSHFPRLAEIRGHDHHHDGHQNRQS